MNYKLQFHGFKNHWTWIVLEVYPNEDQNELAQFYLTIDAIEYLKARGAIAPARTGAR